MSLASILLALAAISFWATNATVAKFALVGLSVEQVQFLQFTSAAVVVGLTQRFSNGEPLWSRPPMKPLMLGIVGFTGTMIFQYLAFANAPITEANIVAYAWPLLAATWVALVWRPSQWVALMGLAVTGFVGVCLVIGRGQALDYASEDALGYAFAIASALCMAVYTVGIAKVKGSSSSVLFPATLCGVAITAVWCFAGNAPWPSFDYILMGIYLGAGPMGVGYLLWSLAVRRGGDGRVAVFGYLTPVLSTVLLLLTGEILSQPAIVGAVLVLASCTLLGFQKRATSYG